MKHDEKTHASWGKINLSRTSGYRNLFRSSLGHHNWITLTISRARVVDNDGTASDFVMSESGHALIEVSMSETQFARMITSVGMGAGAPCTIEEIGGEKMPQCEIEDRKKYIQDAHEQHSEKHKSNVSELLGKLQRMQTDKHRPTLKELGEIIHHLAVYTGNFEANQKYYRERFAEEVEDILDEAKAEIETHILHTAGKLGISRDELPKILEGSHDE